MLRTSTPASTLLITSRVAVLGAFATLAVACAQTDATAPTRLIAGRTANASGTPVANGAHTCTPDAKLIGRFAASTEYRTDTWWGLTRDRFDAAGVSDYKAALESFYGQTFNTLDDAIQFLIDGVASYDANGNGYVCAFEVRGTRAYFSVNAKFLLGIEDDKHVQD
jgi:hypothetical protein